MPIPKSMKHVQSCYHRPLLTQLFKTDSKSKLHFVAIFPYLLYFLNFCFHHLGKIYSQKGERGKGGGERGMEHPNLMITYWSFNEPGQEGWVKRTPDKNTTISNFKVKTIKKIIIIKLFQEPRWREQKSHSTHTYCPHQHTGP